MPHHIGVARVGRHLSAQSPEPVGCANADTLLSGLYTLVVRPGLLVATRPRRCWGAKRARCVSSLQRVSERLSATPHVTRVAEVERAVPAVSVLVFALEASTAADLVARVHALAEGDLRVERVGAVSAGAGDPAGAATLASTLLASTLSATSLSAAALLSVPLPVASCRRASLPTTTTLPCTTTPLPTRRAASRA